LLNNDIAAVREVGDKKNTTYPSTEQASMSIRSRRIQLLLPISPPLVMGTSQKRYLESGQTKQECDPNRTRIFLGDWNAGKEDDNLPGPNFGVPRDLFKEKREKSDTWTDYGSL